MQHWQVTGRAAFMKPDDKGHNALKRYVVLIKKGFILTSTYYRLGLGLLSEEEGGAQAPGWRDLDPSTSELVRGQSGPRKPLHGVLFSPHRH